MVNLVCIDVDGTLIGSSGEAPPAVWDAAARARALGIRLALCTGRPAFGVTRGYAERLNGTGWHVFQEIYTDSDYATESTGARARRHAGLLGLPFRPRDFGSLEGRIVRAQWLLAHDEAEAVLAEPHDELNLSLSHAPQMPDTAFVNVTPSGVDKASAVREIADACGVPLERVMMVGDGYNDLGVMRVVGHPVAMGNAEREIHAVARRSVGHVDAGGLAEALELAIRLARSEAQGSPAA